MAEFVIKPWANTRCGQQLYHNKVLQLGVQGQTVNITDKFYTYEIFRHYVIQYRYKNKINIAVVVSENNFVIEEKFWVVDSRVARCIYA